MIRRATIDDIPDLLDIARACYRKFDERASWEWAVKMMSSPDTAIIRDDDAFAVAAVRAPFWEPDIKHGYMLFLALRSPAALWQGIKVLRTLKDWCIAGMGAEDFNFGAETGMDMGVFAKRLKATPSHPSFICMKG